MSEFKKEAYDYWGDRFPKKVKMRRTIKPDMPILCKDPSIKCIRDEIYDVKMNPYGAVYVQFHGETLGLKPDEFDVIEYFDPTRHPRRQTND